MSKINPQITTIEVGVRELREVTIFPLSFADQTRTARILAKVFQEVMDRLASLGEGLPEGEGSLPFIAKQLSNIDIMEFVASTIQENIEIILQLVVDPHEKIALDELTNEQLYTLVEMIYEVNYEATSKNFIALGKRARGTVPMEKKIPEKKVRRKVSHSKKPSPGSADGTITD
jgi:hypothetical protein